jgi:hypothetical protein
MGQEAAIDDWTTLKAATLIKDQKVITMYVLAPLVAYILKPKIIVRALCQ